MNEQAEQLITEAGEKVLAYLEATEGFAVEQAPLLAQEIVLYGIWWNGFVATSWVLVSVLAIWSLYRSVRYWGARLDEKPDAAFSASIVTTSISAVAILVCVLVGWYETYTSASAALKALIAPRLYILEQLGGMLG